MFWHYWVKGRSLGFLANGGFCIGSLDTYIYSLQVIYHHIGCKYVYNFSKLIESRAKIIRCLVHLSMGEKKKVNNFGYHISDIIFHAIYCCYVAGRFGAFLFLSLLALDCRDDMIHQMINQSNGRKIILFQAKTFPFPFLFLMITICCIPGPGCDENY